MAVHPIPVFVLVLFVVLLYASAANAQSSPPARCRSVCRRVQTVARNDCNRALRRGISNCVLAECTLPTGRKGWSCIAVNPETPSAQVSPSPHSSQTAPTPPRVCRNRCYRYRLPAFRDCRVLGEQRPGCEIRPCAFSAMRMGYTCTEASPSLSPSPLPSPSPSPSLIPSSVVMPSTSPLVSSVLTNSPQPTIPTSPKACRNRCYRSSFPAWSECRYKGGALQGCQFRRCVFSPSRAELGYICAPLFSPSPVPSPSPSDSVNPSACPSPSPSPSSPDDEGNADEFLDQVLATGSEENSVRVPADDGTGGEFDVSFNVTLKPAGAISLEAFAYDTEIECFADGSVHIRFNDSVPVGDLSAMYPINASLVISQDVFGSCVLAPPVDRPGETVLEEQLRLTGDNSLLFADAVLIIESVTGSPRDHVVHGKKGTFFTMFSKGRIDIQAAESTNVSTRYDIDHFGKQSPILPHTSRLTRSISRSKSLGPLTVTATGSVTVDSDYKGSTWHVDWDEWSIDFSVTLTYQVIVEAKLDATLEGSGDDSIVEDLFSVRVYGIPKIKLLWGLFSIKGGVFLELAVVLSVSGEIPKRTKNVARATAKTTKTEITLFLRGPWNDLDAGRSVKTIEKASRSFNFDASADFDEPIEMSLNIFSGLQPRVAVYLSDLAAKIFFDVGPDYVGVIRPEKKNAFPPVKKGRTVGICDSCHHLQIYAALKIKDLTLSLEYDGEELGSLKLPGNPSLKFGNVKACLIKQYGDDQELCGEMCCDTGNEEMCDNSGKEPMCSGSPSPTPSSSRSPTPTPSPPGRRGSCYTDPHIFTFDVLSYDCQGIGVFTMAKSSSAQFEIQARFEGPNTRGTVTKGLALTSKDSSTVQVSLAVNDSTPSEAIIGCPVIMFVDGALRNIMDGTGSKSVTVTVSGREVEIVLKNSITVSFRVQVSSFFGCYFEFLRTFIPDSLLTGGDVRGVLGTPNGDPFDDWITQDGSVLPVPESRDDLLFRKAYEYCTTHWCVRNESKSLFSYEVGSMFEDFNECDRAYEPTINFNDASDELRELCGDDSACLIDGIVGGIEDARNTLQVQAEEERRLRGLSSFKFDPAVVQAGTTINVLITVNVSQVDEDTLDDLTRFDLFLLNTESGTEVTSEIFGLEDDGSGTSTDEVEGDLLFTNLMAIRTETAGQLLSFRAIPVFNNVLDRSSPLVLTALNAVRSYSADSNVTDVFNENRTATVPSLNGMELLVRFSWRQDFGILDTATLFIGEEVGWSCESESSTDYIQFRGDIVSPEGVENVIVLLDKARKDGVWSSSTTVRFRAGWYIPDGGSGPATLRMVLRDEVTKEEVAASRLAIAIDPGEQSDCAEKLVGILTVDVGATVRMKLSPQ